MENVGVHEIILKKVYNTNSRGLSMDRDHWANQDLRSIQRKRGLKKDALKGRAGEEQEQ